VPQLEPYQNDKIGFFFKSDVFEDGRNFIKQFFEEVLRKEGVIENLIIKPVEHCFLKSEEIHEMDEENSSREFYDSVLEALGRFKVEFHLYLEVLVPIAVFKQMFFF